MVTGQIPFNKAQNLEQLHEYIIKCEYEIPKKLSADLKDLIAKLLVKAPSQRLSADEILEHPWVLPSNQSYEQMKTSHKIKNQTNDIILSLMQFGFSQEAIKTNLEKNTLSHICACFYLLKDQN